MIQQTKKLVKLRLFNDVLRVLLLRRELNLFQELIRTVLLPERLLGICSFGATVK